MDEEQRRAPGAQRDDVGHHRIDVEGRTAANFHYDHLGYLATEDAEDTE
jgi:hypothetical protein